MGIAGGVINTQVLKMFGYPIKVAIGCSAAVGFVIALIGAIGFAISGSYLNINVPLSLGFVNIPTFLIFVPIQCLWLRLEPKQFINLTKGLLESCLVFIFLLYLVNYFMSIFLFKFFDRIHRFFQ